MEFFALTVGAYAYELQLMTKNVKPLKFTNPAIIDLNRSVEDVIDPSTSSTANMVVVFDDPIESGFIVTCVELTDQPITRK
jgi:hypothetical protein